MKPFLQGRKTLASPSLAAQPQSKTSVTLPSVSHPSGHSSSNHGGPSVEVIKEGDKVVRLIVVCSCGERTEVECLYTPGR